MIYEFENCVLDAATQELYRDGSQVAVEPQVLAVLEYLIAHRDRVVTKIELLDEVWGDRFVSESALTSRIKLARRACGDSGRAQRIVKTVHGRGYRVVAEVAERRHGRSVDRSVTVERSAIGGSVVGRDAELSTLDDAFEAVEHGDARIVFVTGEAGSGKSTLVAEFLERHDLDGWLLLRGQCIEVRGAAEPYFAVLDALASGSRSEPDVIADALERVAPSWLGQLPGLVDDDVVERIERRLLGSSPQRMLREGVDALHELAAGRPVALIVEDLHWADDSTLDLMDLLARRLRSLPLLVVGTSRPEADTTIETIAAATGAGLAEQIGLGPLAVEAVEELVALRFDGVGPAAELLAVINDRCEGVPLFAHEIVTTWLREDLVAVAGDTVVGTVPLAELEAVVPKRLRSLIDRKLGSLDADEIDVLEAASVAGVMFDGASVAVALDRSVDEVEQVLTGLERRTGDVAGEGGVSWSDGTISTAYVFGHQLYRDVVYERIPVARRADLHGRIGRALETRDAGRSAEMAVVLAEHFVQAGDVDRTVEHLKRAGEQAAGRGAYGPAIDFLSGALDRVVELPAGPGRDRAELNVRVVLGPALVATKGWIDGEVAANYERAVALSDVLGPCPEAAGARYGMATVTELRGQFDRTEALLSPLLTTSPPGVLSMEAHELSACSTFHQGAFSRSEQIAGTALESWDDDDYSVLMARIAEHPTSSCNSWLSLSCWFLGRVDESIEHAVRAVELGEQNPYALTTALQQRAMLHQLRNEPDACIEWADRAHDVGRQQDSPMRMIQADIYKGWALGVSGSAASGLALISDGIARFRDAGATLNEAYYMALEADALLCNERGRESLAVLDRSLDVMRNTTRTYFHESEIYRLRARALDATGAPHEEVSDALDTSVRLAHDMGSPVLALRTTADRVEFERRDGDATRWEGELTRLLAGFGDQHSVPDTIRAAGLVAN